MGLFRHFSFTPPPGCAATLRRLPSASVWDGSAEEFGALGIPFARRGQAAGYRLDDLWPKALSQVDRYEPEIRTVARELFWRGRLSGIDIEVLIGGGWTPPRWA